MFEKTTLETIKMKCILKNTCNRKVWCCNFCNITCAIRCKDDCKKCKWFVNEKIEEETQQND